MNWNHQHIRNEDDAVSVWLPDGSSVEITYDGSDPKVVLRDWNGDKHNLIPE